MAAQARKVSNGTTSSSADGEPNAFGRAAERVNAKWTDLWQFFHDVRVEMRQVTWPTWADVRSTTGVVIATVFFFGVYLFLVDLGVSRAVTHIIDFFRK
jgi:preprotein translocase subunit SecE